MGEFTIKCGKSFDIFFNDDDDESLRVTVAVHDEYEGENIPIVEVLKNDGTPLTPEKTRSLSKGGGITTLPVAPGQMIRVTCGGTGTGEGKRCTASAEEKEKKEKKEKEKKKK